VLPAVILIFSLGAIGSNHEDVLLLLLLLPGVGCPSMDHYPRDPALARRYLEQGLRDCMLSISFRRYHIRV